MAEMKPTRIQQFLKYLSECEKRGDRGVLADLRHGFSQGTEHRAWPHLAQWSVDLCNDRERCIWLTVAAGFAHGLNLKRCGNIGKSMRRLAGSNLDSFDGRFRRLLTCSSSEELCPLLVGPIRAARQKGVDIDFETLFWDLQRWPVDSRGRDVRIEWAQAYWGSDTMNDKDTENPTL